MEPVTKGYLGKPLALDEVDEVEPYGEPYISM